MEVWSNHPAEDDVDHEQMSPHKGKGKEVRSDSGFSDTFCLEFEESDMEDIPLSDDEDPSASAVNLNVEFGQSLLGDSVNTTSTSSFVQNLILTAAATVLFRSVKDQFNSCIITSLRDSLISKNRWLGSGRMLRLRILSELRRKNNMYYTAHYVSDMKDYIFKWLQKNITKFLENCSDEPKGFMFSEMLNSLRFLKSRFAKMIANHKHKDNLPCDCQEELRKHVDEEAPAFETLMKLHDVYLQVLLQPQFEDPGMSARVSLEKLEEVAEEMEDEIMDSCGCDIIRKSNPPMDEYFFKKLVVAEEGDCLVCGNDHFEEYRERQPEFKLATLAEEDQCSCCGYSCKVMDSIETTEEEEIQVEESRKVFMPWDRCSLLCNVPEALEEPGSS